LQKLVFAERYGRFSGSIPERSPG